MKAEQIREILYNTPFNELKFGKYENHIRENQIFHVRFDMSGFDNEGKLGATEINTNIILLFAKHGIYQNFEFLVLKFWKGSPTIYYSYKNNDTTYIEEGLQGFTTCEIIERIYQLQKC
jgi:hypothetical protein